MFFFVIIIMIIFMLFIYKAHRNTHEAVFHRVKVRCSDNDQDVVRILHLSDLHLENLSIS